MKFLKRCVATLSAMAMLAGMSSLLPAQAASVVSVDSSQEYQYIRGYGGINHPEWTGKDMDDAQRKTAFGNGDNQLGLTVLRVFVNPNKNQWNLAVPTAKYASQNGVTVFASPWEPPSNLAESGGGKGKLHLPRSNYAAYAEHLNNFGNYMKQNGVDLYSISVQNEPDYASEWTYWSTDDTTEFLANYADKITSTRVMSPESFQYSPDGASWISGGDGGKRFYTKILNNAKAMANCDLFGTHFYGTTRQWMDFPALEASGKEIWMTEVYVPNSEANSANRWPEALDVAENIHNAMVVSNMSAYTWWYIRRSYGLMDEDGKITKRGYMMAQYSKYVRPGAHRIDCTEIPTDKVYTSAYKNEDGSIVIVAVNKGASEYTQQFSIDSGEKISSVTRYRTTGSENLAKSSIDVNGNGFFANLPSNSVSTFVIECEGGGTYVPPVDDDGYFFHDRFEADTCGWEKRGGSSIMTSGRCAYEGSESLLIQERTSAWHGARKVLNTRVFKPGTAYSFSVNACFMDSDDPTDTLCLKLEYTGSDGEAHYATIAEGEVGKGNFIQLANTSFMIPEGATNVSIYVETPESLINFYIDDAIGAPEGTVIKGAEPTELPTDPPATEPATDEPTEPTTEATEPPTEPVAEPVKGDLNQDNMVDIYDLAMLKRYLIKGFDNDFMARYAADLTGDGGVDVADLILMQKYILGIVKSIG